MIVADRRRAHLILAGEITSLRLPTTGSRRTPTQGRLVPVKHGPYSSTVGHVVITRAHKSRHLTHPPEVACPLVHPDAAAREDEAIAAGRSVTRLCHCPLAGHEDTLTADEVTLLGGNRADHIWRWLLDHDTEWLADQADDPDSHDTTDDAARAVLLELAEAEASRDDDSGPLETRWRERWARKPVWVVHVKPVAERPLYLLARPGRESYLTLPSGRQTVNHRLDPDTEHGYTRRRSLGLPDEPEAVDAQRLRSHWGEEASSRHARDRGRSSRRPGQAA